MTSPLPPHLASLAEKLAEAYYEINPHTNAIRAAHKAGFRACYQTLLDLEVKEFDEHRVITEATAWPFSFVMPQTLPPRTYYPHDEVMQAIIAIAKLTHSQNCAVIAALRAEIEQLKEEIHQLKHDDPYFEDNVRLVEKLASTREEIERLKAEDQKMVARLHRQSGIMADLERELVTAREEFKNFHSNLCKRFNYTHDEQDWKRDQASLEEYIANQLTTEKAKVARLVTALEWYADEKNLNEETGAHGQYVREPNTVDGPGETY